MASVSLQNITKRYIPPIGAPAGQPPSGLENISLTIADGETLSVVGPSGCGKSTLLKVIAGLEFADQGKILYNNHDVTQLSPQARGVGMVFQDYALYPSKEGEDNLGYYFEVRKKTPEEKERRLRETAEMMGIGFETLMDRKVDTLSGGEKQRVGIARCIVREPHVFLMDEPISNLDAKLRESTRTEIKKLLKKFGITTLYVTHDQQEAIFMGDRIAIMRTGRLEQIGTFDELYYSPANLFVATLIGTPPINVIPAQIRDSALWVDGADSPLPLPAHLAASLPQTGPLRLGVRPESWVHNPGAAHSALTLSISRVERLFTERAAFAGGHISGVPINVLVPLDFPENLKEIRLQPDWSQAYFFAAEGETALHTPGAPDLF